MRSGSDRVIGEQVLVVATTLGVAEARYRLLESIREYALEKLNQAAETKALRDRHIDLFVVRAEEAAPRLGDAYQQLWLAWLDSEYDNICSALAWAEESGQIEKGLRICCSIPRYWEIRGRLPEGMVWLDRLLIAADDDVALGTRVQAHAFASFAAMRLGEARASMSHARAAIKLAEGLDDADQASLALALNAYGTAARTAGDFQTAFEVGERALPIYRQIGPRFHLSMTLLTQGALAIELGAHARARTLLDESLVLAAEDGDAFRIGAALIVLGHLARCQQDYEQARSAYERGIAAWRTIGAQADLASALANLGHVCLHLNEVETGLACFDESLALHQAQANRAGMAESLVGFAALALMRDLPAVGARLLGASIASGGSPGTGVQLTTCLERDHYVAQARAMLGDAKFEREQAVGAAMSLDQALDFAHKLIRRSGAVPKVEPSAGGLTEREREIAGLIARGRTNGEIADELVLSKRTVEKHVGNLLSKLELTNRAQLVRWALDHGLAA